METNVKRFSVIGLLIAFIASVLAALFAMLPFSVNVTASAATSAKITGVGWHSSGCVFLYTDVPTDPEPSNINHGVYLSSWRYENISVNGIMAENGGAWDNTGYFENNGDGTYKYTLPFTMEDLETIEASSDGYKYINFKITAGGYIGAEYILGNDFEFTVVFTSDNTFSSIAKTAKITQVINYETDDTYYWYRFYTNVLASETATNYNHEAYLTPWRTELMRVNGKVVTSEDAFYYMGYFQSASFHNEDGTTGNSYYAFMTGISKAAVEALGVTEIDVDFLVGRNLGNEYIFGSTETICMDYSSGSSGHYLPIANVSVASHAYNETNENYEIFLNLPGVTDFKNSGLIAPIRAAIKVDGNELSDEEKNSSYFTDGLFKIVGSKTGAFSARKIHEVTIAKGTQFESDYFVNTVNGAGFVEGYTNRALAEDIRFYVYQNNNGEWQFSENKEDIVVEEDAYIGEVDNVANIIYTEGKGWKITIEDTSMDDGCFRFLLKKEQTATAIAEGNGLVTITFGGSFDGTSHTGNPVNCRIWFLLPNAGNGNLTWIHGSWISGLTDNGDGTYSHTIDLEDAAYDFETYDIQFRVNYLDVANSDVGAAYIHAIEYSKKVSFDTSNIEMVEGASVRMSKPTGLGFTTRIDKAAYDELVAACGEENVTTGTLILPTDYLTCDFTIEVLAANGIAYKNIVNEGWKNAATVEKDGYYEYRGSLAPIQEYNYGRDFSSVGYISYTIKEETHYVYTAYEESKHSRSVAHVAQMAYEDLYEAVPAKNTWLTPASDEDTTVAYTEGAGWKIDGASHDYFNFYLESEIIDFHLAQGATELTLTAGGSFDGTTHAGAPVNCQAWIIPKNSSNEDAWEYKAGFISGWTDAGDGKYTYKIDLMDSDYNFAGNDIRIRVNALDVNNNQVGAFYMYDISFNIEEKDVSKYPYALEKDELTFIVEGLYSPYTTEQRKVLSQYILFDSNITLSYKIVKPTSATESETTAANLLAQYFQESMGVTLEVISDSAVTGFSGFSKYISVGQTALLEAAGLGEYAENNVEYDGYIIKTLGCALFIDGIVDRGTVYGVMDFAEKYLGYVFIDGECYTVDSVESLEVKDIADITFTPYIETRSYLEYDVCQGYTDAITAVSRKNNNYYVWGVDSYGGANNFGYWGDNAAHTMQATLEKGIELDGGTKAIADYAYKYQTGSLTAGYVTHYQPCLTNETTKSLMANAMKELIKAKYASGIRYYTLTQEDSTDTTGYCTCSTCSNARTTYGGQSGVTLKFMNDIVAILDSDAEFSANYSDYKLYTYAYNYSFEYPTVANTVIKACDKVAVMICSEAANGMKDLFDSDNSNSKTALEGWHNYCEDLMIWIYDANFSNYVEYHPTLTGVIADNVYKLKQLGASYIMINGAYNSDGLWDDKLRAYVYSELLYDFDETAYNAGADAYVNSIVSEYLTAYYGTYATTVQSVIDFFQNSYKGLTLKTNVSLAENLSESELQTQLSNIQAAIDENTDETIEKRLYAVKASILATLYEIDKPVLPSFWSNKSEFITACNYAGITMWSETGSIADKFGS